MKPTIPLTLILAAAVIAGCTLPSVPIHPYGPCLASGDQNTINAALHGPGDAAILCPGALFQLTGPVVYTAAGQQIYTRGNPLDDTRATLRIVAPKLASAITMRDFDRAVLSNVIVDGNRPLLGPLSGDALVYAGGYSDGQIIRGNRIMNTRSWSSLQLIQGYSDRQPCQNAVVENNEIGPAGTSDNMLWADGISLACTHSSVRLNSIEDATDGGIVVFGAPGSVIESNVVIARTRTLLGGINMVDEGVYGGSYAGTIVRNNIINASGAVIRIGLGMGPRVWGCFAPTEPGHIITGGTVSHNRLQGTHMQYGYAVDGVSDWTVTDNADDARHTGAPSVPCGSLVASPPAGFLIDPAHSTGTFQPEFRRAQLDLALWAIVDPRPGE